MTRDQIIDAMADSLLRHWPWSMLDKKPQEVVGLCRGIFEEVIAPLMMGVALDVKTCLKAAEANAIGMDGAEYGPIEIGQMFGVIIGMYLSRSVTKAEVMELAGGIYDDIAKAVK